MVDGFDGFKLHPGRSVQVPDVFFTTLLPEIRSVLELKVTLHLMWVLSQRVGKPRCIEWEELCADQKLLQSVRVEEGPRPAEDYLREGLELAVTRGSVLQVHLRREHVRQTWYLLNTEVSRSALERLQSGQPGGMLDIIGPQPVDEVRLYRPNIYALYEQNIGPLTPMIAERLRLAEKQFPAAWIQDAIRMAVEYNKRNWRYVEAILQRWEADGKDDGIHRRVAEEDADPYGYFRSKYQHLYR